jgi:hypothetical protein
MRSMANLPGSVDLFVYEGIEMTRIDKIRIDTGAATSLAELELQSGDVLLFQVRTAAMELGASLRSRRAELGAGPNATAKQFYTYLHGRVEVLFAPNLLHARHAQHAQEVLVQATRYDSYDVLAAKLATALGLDEPHKLQLRLPPPRDLPFNVPELEARQPAGRGRCECMLQMATRGAYDHEQWWFTAFPRPIQRPPFRLAFDILGCGVREQQPPPPPLQQQDEDGDADPPAADGLQVQAAIAASLQPT